MQTTHFTSVTQLLHPQVALMICFSKTLQHLHFCKEMNYSSRLLPLAEHKPTGFMGIFCHWQSLPVCVYLHCWSQGSVVISVTCPALVVAVTLETYSAVSVLPAHFCQPSLFAGATGLYFFVFDPDQVGEHLASCYYLYFNSQLKLCQGRQEIYLTCWGPLQTSFYSFLVFFDKDIYILKIIILKF